MPTCAGGWRRNVTIKIEVVRRKLLEIPQAVARIQSWQPLTVERLEQDLMVQWAVERGLQIAAESLFDAGAHILAGEFREAVDEYREIPPRLAALGVIAPETARRLAGLAGFRTALVHDYAKVDLRKVHAGLGRLDDIEAFVADIERWLEVRGRSV
ncbi:MAG: DUF86 domain-containing protein [Myxococcales bacterium]|nr:DUF86 domain-containing protein [Myxococcales bacterium]